MTALLGNPAEADPRRPHLIAAGPGTGKTRTMVERYRWLVQHEQLPAESILAVTFTEAAAGEWRERLQLELGQPLDEAPIGTFHGICSRLLQEHAYEIGLPRELRPLDDVDQRLLQRQLGADLLRGTAGELPDDLGVLQPDDIDSLLRRGPSFALQLKGRGISPAEFLRLARLRHEEAWGAGSKHDEGLAELESVLVLHAVYVAYEERLRALARLDFDDLLLLVTRALEDVPSFAERCHRRFAHILVDEFQDTNRLQLDLIRRLAAPDFGNVTAVGDEKQSIYGWRDADVANISRRFPGERIPLTRNWRSRQEILDLATEFIRRDPEFAREPDLAAARGAGGCCVSLVMARDAETEARQVVARVRAQIRSGRPAGAIAILASSVRGLPAAFENELRLQGVPYVTSAGSGFFDREEVKDMLALLRLVADPMDDGALVRVLQGPIVRLSDRELYRIAHRRLELQEDGISLYRERGVRLRDCVERARAEGWPELDPAAARRVAETLAAIDDLGARSDTLSVAELLQQALDVTGYLRHATLRARREGPRALRNLHKVTALASRFETQQAMGGIVDFVERMQEVMDATVPVAEAEEEAADAVHLLTVHAAKGLEFESVFLVHVEPPRTREGGDYFFDPDTFGFVRKWWRGRVMRRFDEHNPTAAARGQQLGERRRIVYVALTRARDELTVSATREEALPADVPLVADDHFAELLQWALANPDAARVVTVEQPELPGVGATGPPPVAGDAPDLVPRLLERVELLEARERERRPAPAGERGPLRLTFSQLHTLDICPVRYRYQEVWRLPEPPDELRWRGAGRDRDGRGGASELGSAVHEALAAAHLLGGTPADHYQGPAEGSEMLRRYAGDPLAAAPTLAVEVEFNLLLRGDGGAPQIRLRGVVDRICQIAGRTTLVDFKTNARIDPRLQAAYEDQLRLYGLAAARGLLPGGPDVALVLFDLRQGRAIPVAPDPERAEARVLAAARRIAAGDLALGPENADRPCFLCAYAPICPDRRRPRAAQTP